MPKARYKQLLDRLADEIRSGRLSPGSRLPTHRALAAREGLALVTASRVYAELAAMGLVSGETGRGTFVKETALPPGQGVDLTAAAPDAVDLSFNYPALPGQAELLRQALRRLAQAGDLEALLRYQPHGGRLRDRASVAHYLRARGLSVPPEQLMLVDGAQHGLALTAMALLQPGDVVAIDALSYPGFKLVAEAFRLELLALPADGPGPDLDVLERLCRRRRVRAVYTMPTLQNPLGWVTGLKRRRALVALARQHGLMLIEDAAYAYLAEPAPPPLAALAPELTVYVSGFSKNVAAGLRVGYLVAPSAWVPAIERAIRATTWNTAGVMTALACGWLDDGSVARLEAEKRADARLRQTLAAVLLKPLPRIGHPASYFLWLPLPEGVRADQLALALMQQGIAVSTAEPYATGKTVPHAIRLALGSVELPVLRQALLRVAEAVAERSV
ncbi:PLP-dependent aminotransferase family protein [Paucibacter sp. APW11]|uniref:PLP-dependent aminotransferase family protein n=1 Tax=Roseateles aquae TaxID=3077235 RepID=A0ABU3PI87_9BURK|nr:PLP-dependent aminotransferase family protein [Paucibacter sp. APW11]MDT9002290.1 PLP-dependent aminotransferase family protein [Paucibacter sp. APW11]